MVLSALGTCNASLHVGQRVARPANSRGTLNFMPHFRHANAILAVAAGASVSSSAGTTRDCLHPEQDVLRPANSGLRRNALPHLEQEKEIIELPGQVLRMILGYERF